MNSKNVERESEIKSRMVKAPDDDVCPICFNDFVNPCCAPCGHWFCGGCIFMYWKYKSVLQPCKCPLCSQKIMKLIPEAPIDSFEDGDTLENIRKYNYRFGRGRHVIFMRDILDFVRQGVVVLPLLMREAFAATMGPNADFTIYDKLRLIMVIIYALCSYSPYLRGAKHTVALIFGLCLLLVFVLRVVGGNIHRWYRRRNR